MLDYELAVADYCYSRNRAELYRALLALGISRIDCHWHASHPGQRLMRAGVRLQSAMATVAVPGPRPFPRTLERRWAPDGSSTDSPNVADSSKTGHNRANQLGRNCHREVSGSRHRNADELARPAEIEPEQGGRGNPQGVWLNPENRML